MKFVVYRVLKNKNYDLIKTHIEFRSDNFPPTSKEKEEWDRQIWGHTLAKYLSEELPKYGLNVSDFINEDWGYLIPLADEKFKGIWIDVIIIKSMKMVFGFHRSLQANN